MQTEHAHYETQVVSFGCNCGRIDQWSGKKRKKEKRKRNEAKQFDDKGLIATSRLAADSSSVSETRSKATNGMRRENYDTLPETRVPLISFL